MRRAAEKRSLVLQNRRLQAERHAVATVKSRAQDTNLAVQMDMVEMLLLEAALRDHRGRVVDAAAALGLPRKTLYDKLNRHGLNAAHFRRPG